MSATLTVPSLIPGLPDEIGLQCLIRVPYQFHSRLKTVCRTWFDLLSESEFYRDRKRAGTAENLVCLVQVVVPTDEGDSSSNSPPNSPRKAKIRQRNRYHQPIYGLTLYNSTTSTWQWMPESALLPAGIPLFCQCVTVPGKLILIGGWNPTTLDSVPNVYVYDFLSGNGWREGKPMFSARSFFACAAVDGLVYVAGGHDNQKNALQTAEVYDPIADKWTILPPLATERDECQGISWRGKFMVVSGYGTETQGRFDSAAELYDPVTESWITENDFWPFSNASPRASICTLKGKIFFLDCGNGGRGLREYSELEKGWKMAANVAENVRSVSSMVALDGEDRFLVTGHSKDGEDCTWVIDGTTGRWKEIITPAAFSGYVYSASFLHL